MKWYDYWIVVVGVLTACSLAHDVIKAVKTGVFEEVLKGTSKRNYVHKARAPFHFYFLITFHVLAAFFILGVMAYIMNLHRYFTDLYWLTALW